MPIKTSFKIIRTDRFRLSCPDLRFMLVALFVITPCLAAPAGPSGGPANGKSPRTEPDMAAALSWWSELPDIWTPIGWKNHMFRFNVMFNGTLVAHPCVNPRTAKWAGEGAFLQFAPSPGPTWQGHLSFPHDDGRVRQGWEERTAPVLWSEWPIEGIAFRQSVFAHIPGGGDVETGVEPIFAWVRLGVRDVIEALPVPAQFGFSVRINAERPGNHDMSMRNNFRLLAPLAKYPRDLSPEPAAYDANQGLRLVEPDGEVRLGVAPGHDGTVTFHPGVPTETESLLFVELEVKPGAYADLLIPMLPTDRNVFDRELKLGYDGALAEAETFWSEKPDTVAHFEVPEPYINEAIDRCSQFVEVVAERNPDDRLYYMLSGSWTYAFLWSTPNAMTLTMLCDSFGYHDVADRYLETVRVEQGTIAPPGEHFTQHPGYLATPQKSAAIHWLSDHGALLYAISSHMLLAGDEATVDKWMPVIEKACDFIKDARANPDHPGVKGIMPPAVYNDFSKGTQGIWNDGWMYKGLTTAVRAMRVFDGPRADEFAREAEDYRKCFTQALREQTKQMETWTDSQGRKHHLVPTALGNQQDWELRHAAYLDTGPLFLVFAGLLNADDPLMRSSLEWFRNGPPTKLYRYDSNCWQIPSLHREVSSFEPCYSWNVFHSHQLADRAKYLEGMYSLFAAMLSRETYTVCETRGGITGTTYALIPIYFARLAVIDDQIEPGSLHLLRMMPLAWLDAEMPARFEKMPTEFGPVSLEVRLDDDGQTLQVDFTPEFRRQPDTILLHIPPFEGLQRVTVNDAPLQWNGRARALTINP